jgi:methanethiol S-methyltransferase
MPVFFVAYALSCYLFFAVTFLAFIGFLAGLPWHPSVDTGPLVPRGEAIAIDLALLAVFGVQHSVMARASFKRAWTRIVPPALERSTFVLASTLALALIVWQWRPIPEPVLWDLSGVPASLMQAAFCSGWLVMLASSFLIDHFDLFGLRQAWSMARKLPGTKQEFRQPLFYRYVRHPLYTGLLIAFWATPRMTAGHLLFAAGFTVYILIGIAFEERDLLSQFGSRYAAYRRQVGMLLPWRRRSA